MHDKTIPCHECARSFQISAIESLRYNKKHPYICKECHDFDKGVILPSDKSDNIREKIDSRWSKSIFNTDYHENFSLDKPTIKNNYYNDDVKYLGKIDEDKIVGYERDTDEDDERTPIGLGMLLPIGIAMIVMIIIFVPISSSITSLVDCSVINGTTIQQVCNTAKDMTSNIWIVLAIVPLVFFGILYGIMRN